MGGQELSGIRKGKQNKTKKEMQKYLCQYFSQAGRKKGTTIPSKHSTTISEQEGQSCSSPP